MIIITVNENHNKHNNNTLIRLILGKTKFQIV